MIISSELVERAKLRAARRKDELRAAGQEHQRDGRREATPERAPRRAGDGARPARCLEEPRGVGFGFGFGFGFYTARDPLVAPAPPGPIRRARTQ